VLLSNWDLSGCVDLHLHSAPDVRPRILDDVDLARVAKAAGYRAILLKSHHTITADRAQIAEKVVGGIRVFGGVVLNWAVGGINPDAVEAAMKMGAREVWFPTISAASELADPTKAHEFKRKGPVHVLDSDGNLIPEVLDVLSLIKEHNAILATGHLSFKEMVPVIKAARGMGIEKIVVTHPEHPLIDLSIGEQKELAQYGLYFERCFCFVVGALAHLKPVYIRDIAGAIREIGPQSTILATDLGRADLPHPIEGLKEYLSKLEAEGLGLEELKLMCSETPARLLDL
jgi:hypothetical protein